LDNPQSKHVQSITIISLSDYRIRDIRYQKILHYKYMKSITIISLSDYRIRDIRYQKILHYKYMKLEFQI